MSFTKQQISIAEVKQDSAAHDSHPQIRLIAGPGTGKSSVIEKRILWLLQKGVSPSNIFAISFTRASSKDLYKRVINYCTKNGHPEGKDVSVSTLHSLALRTLCIANLLPYPGTPSILDDWELKNIIDKEFSFYSGYRHNKPTKGYKPSRCEEIRRDYEAFCGTGKWDPVNFVQPNPPIKQEERDAYQKFHLSRTTIYECLLPGEIVLKCLEFMRINALNPEKLLNIKQFIVDEYQDLNPLDIEFIDQLTNNGVSTFVAGDDDQSIYSFRFAMPSGIQLYDKKYINAPTHSLDDCFRCTPKILNSANSLINNFADKNRITKKISSLYTESNPPINGSVYLWHFYDCRQEARAVAQSISQLTKQGIDPKQIMVLLANLKIQLKTITDGLEEFNILYESPREESFFDKEAGRLIIGIFRLVRNDYDYFAYRLILGSLPHIGPKTCNDIAELVETNNLNYRDLFCTPVTKDIFSNKIKNIIYKVQDICQIIHSWKPDDTLEDRIDEINNIINNIFGQKEVKDWQNNIQPLPVMAKLDEVLDFITTENREQKDIILKDINTRLQIPFSVCQDNNKVQIMTMHGAKGLSAQIVFIPGLESQILPGQKRNKKSGLVLEAARMFYVSITRARASCIISYASNRYYYGERHSQTPSDYLKYLNGKFEERKSGLTKNEIEEIVHDCSNL